MKEGQWKVQVNRSWEILAKLNLVKTRNKFPAYTENAASEFKNLTYFETWKKCYSYNIFDFALRDNSIIQLRAQSFAPLDLSYCFYECPYAAQISFDEYIASLGNLDELEEEFDLGNEYEEYVTQQMKDMCTPIRYDFTPQFYKEGRHPASHIHFGAGNHIRIGTKKILRPISFICFIIRQMYPDKWHELASWPEAELLIREVKDNLDDIHHSHWKMMDTWEMVLV